MIRVIGGDFKRNGIVKLIKKKGVVKTLAMPTSYTKAQPYLPMNIQSVTQQGNAGFRMILRVIFTNGKAALLSMNVREAGYFIDMGFDAERRQDTSPTAMIEKISPKTSGMPKRKSRLKIFFISIAIIFFLPLIVFGLIESSLGGFGIWIVIGLILLSFVSIFRPPPKLWFDNRGIHIVITFSLLVGLLVSTVELGETTQEYIGKKQNVPQQTVNVSDASQAVNDVPVLPAIVKSTSIEDCKVITIKAWQNQCQRIIGYVVVKAIWEGEYPTKLTLAYDGDRVSLLGLIPKREHLKYYTNQLPTTAMIDKEPYVVNQTFFTETLPPHLVVGGVSYDHFEWEGYNQWVATPEETVRLISAFKKGLVAEVNYYYDGAGKSFAKISLAGFTAIFKSATAPEKAQNVTIETIGVTSGQAIKQVRRYINDDNKFEVKLSDLTAIKNPRGKGFFVYAPKTRYFGVQRWFIWFVKDASVVKLNGATNALTPDLPFPRNAPPELWRETGLKDNEVTSAGINLVFK